jgi:hypothetical protein
MALTRRTGRGKIPFDLALSEEASRAAPSAKTGDPADMRRMP